MTGDRSFRVWVVERLPSESEAELDLSEFKGPRGPPAPSAPKEDGDSEEVERTRLPEKALSG